MKTQALIINKAQSCGDFSNQIRNKKTITKLLALEITGKEHGLEQKLGPSVGRTLLGPCHRLETLPESFSSITFLGCYCSSEVYQEVSSVAQQHKDDAKTILLVQLEIVHRGLEVCLG